MSISKDFLLPHLTNNHRATRRLLEDVTDKESLVTVPNTNSHIRWITGHIITTCYSATKALKKEPTIDPSLLALFKRGEPVAADSSLYPSMDVLRVSIQTIHEELQQAANDATDEILQSPFGDPASKTSVLNWVLTLASHDFYHTGQIMLIRRHLGKEALFG
ncbi:MAG: DinB family protein [candidate division Zixibacteria bacterium]|nr:DinB family protein [candidate division Zixibacteria bacterium]